MHSKHEVGKGEGEIKDVTFREGWKDLVLCEARCSSSAATMVLFLSLYPIIVPLFQLAAPPPLPLPPAPAPPPPPPCSCPPALGTWLRAWWWRGEGDDVWWKPTRRSYIMPTFRLVEFVKSKDTEWGNWGWAKGWEGLRIYKESHGRKRRNCWGMGKD